MNKPVDETEYEFDRQTKIRKADDVVIEVEGDTATVVNNITGRILVVNAVGYRVLEICETPNTPIEIAERISDEFKGKIPIEEVGKDVDAFLLLAISKGIVKWI